MDGTGEWESRPALIVVSGPAGAGKTTLAHAVARAVGCPAVCRDEIKEGMVHATPDFPGTAPGDPLTMRTLGVFFDVLGLLLRSGTTVVAEAAFQDHVWRPRLEPLADLGTLRIIRCRADRDVRGARVVRRDEADPVRQAHGDAESRNRFALGPFTEVSMDVPTLDVDTGDGYRPGLDAIAAFARGDQSVLR